MTEYRIIKEYTERRTYLHGDFRGKYTGLIDMSKSDGEHENFYDIEITEADVFIKSENLTKDNENADFCNTDLFPGKLPHLIPCQVTYPNGEIKYFRLNLKQVRLKDCRLFNLSHEKDIVFGSISGMVSGYITHYDITEREVAIEEAVLPPRKTDIQTGQHEQSGNYIREEGLRSDGSTYWNDWKYIPNKSRWSIWNILSTILSAIILGMFLVPILFFGWRLILILLAVAFVIYLLFLSGRLIGAIGSWLFRIIGVGVLCISILGIAGLFLSKKTTYKRQHIQDKSEVSFVTEDSNGDSIIIHHRVWSDYSENNYTGNIEIKTSDYKSAGEQRNLLPYSLQSPSDYNRIVTSICAFDSMKLDRIYKMFDSLRAIKKPGSMAFAEIITACIQDIPYTLVLNKACQPSLYSDDFITEYLQSGGACSGNIKYGILSPVEFMATLQGDCDTRTLLLFTVLSHYGYDVAMLGSDIYKHSIIGINLPYNGLSKMINGKNYVVWETTQKGIKPGILSREVADMRFWNVNLISKQTRI